MDHIWDIFSQELAPPALVGVKKIPALLVLRPTLDTPPKILF